MNPFSLVLPKNKDPRKSVNLLVAKPFVHGGFAPFNESLSPKNKVKKNPENL